MNSIVNIAITPYKNPARIKSHEGHYAYDMRILNPKYVMSDDDYLAAFELAQESFFIQADVICRLYGFSGYSVEGKYSRWLKPLNEEGTYKPFNAPIDEYISFEEYVIEDRIASMFAMLDRVYKDIKDILMYSESYNKFQKTIERYMSI